MNRLLYRIIPLYVFYTILQGYLTAQSFTVKKYTIEDGLKSNVIFDIDQDKSGKIWIATENGVSSYDGKIWTAHIDHNRPPLVEYTHLAIDEDNQIWAMPKTLSFNLKMYDRNHWYSINVYPYEEYPNLSVQSFDVFNKAGSPRVLIGTTQGLLIWEKNKTRLLLKKDGLLGNNINCIAKHGERFFIGTENGISILDGDKIDNSLTSSIPPEYRNIVALQIVTDSHTEIRGSFSIYFTTLGVIGRIDSQGIFTLLTKLGNKFEGFNTRKSIQYDNVDRVYFGNEYVKYYFELSSKKIVTLNPSNGFVNSGANSILIDNEKNTWFATYRGLEKLSSSAIQNYYIKDGLFEDEVSTIVERGNNSFILGHNAGITFLKDSQAHTINLEKGDLNITAKPRRVLVGCRDLKGNVYIASTERGLGKIDFNNNITWIKKNNELFTCVTLDKFGQVWTSSVRTIYRVIDDNLVEYDKIDISFINIRQIYFDNNDNLYVSTRNGLIVYPKNEINHKKIYSNDEIKDLYCVKEFEPNRILLGTASGLFVLEHDRIQKFINNGFEIKDKVFSLLKDRGGNWWLGTNNGVLNWSGNKLKRFSIENGLAGRETNRGALIVDQKGYIWIGTESGLSRYDEKYDFTVSPPNLVEFYIENKKGEKSKFDDNESIPFEQRDLTFEITGISYQNEKEISYRAKLGGLEGIWVEYGKNSRLRYTNLPSGEYRLYVQAKNYSSGWSRTFASPNIVIETPFYHTWWFRIILLLISLSLLRIIIKYISQKQYSKELEEEVEQRTLALKDSENKLGTLLHNAPNYIFSIDKSGKINFANKTVTDNSNVNLIGSSFFDFFPPEDHVELREKINVLFNKKEALQYTHKYFSPSGEVRLFDSHANPLIKDNEVIEAIVISVDITDVKLIEETQKNILEKVPLILYKSSAELGYATTWISDNVINITGYPKAKYLSELSFWSSNLHPDDKERVISLFNTIELNKDLQIEYRWKCADGSYKWFSDFIVPRSMDRSGNLEYFGIWLDITEKKVTQFRLENLTNTLLSLGTNPDQNINDLITLCGNELKASFAVYYKKISDEINLSASWQLPANYDEFGKQMYSVLVDLNRKNKKEPFYVYDTAEETNAKTKEVFIKENIRTYAGFPISFGDSVTGIYCVLFSEPTNLNEDDLKFISIIGAAITIEEERKNVIELLKISVKEKDILLREVYHRVKNNLQIISSLLFLQSTQVKDKELLTMFKESQNRVRSMALVHEKLYQSADLTNINLREYLRSLVQFLIESFGIDDSITINIKVEDLNLAVDKAIPCGLIINELLSNAFKYAFSTERIKEVKPELLLELKEINENFELIIKDNGIGLPATINIRDKNSTLGIKLVNLLTLQLHGQLNYEYENGAKFTILFPKSD